MHLPRFPRQHARREPGVRVGFLEHDRDAAPSREPERRPRRVAAGANRECRSLGVEEAYRGTPHAPQGHGPAHVARPGAAVDRFQREQVVTEWVGRQDLRFDAPLRADQHRLVTCVLGGSCQREGRHQVAARAAACNQDLPPAAAPRLRPRATLTSTPVAARATINEERPYDMNGSVTPVAGMTARLTPRCSTTLRPIITLIPVASSWPNGSDAWRAIRKPSHTNVPNRSAIAITPRKPHSSPMVEKMKSEDAY